MSKAEEFIQENTKDCSNQYDLPEYFENGIKRLKEYQPWLSPDDARKAVEIAREEIIEQTVEWLTKHAIKYYINSKGFLGTEELVKDYKLIMSMKDE
jgi:hypothetical protein